jgi:hypothetical protein
MSRRIITMNFEQLNFEAMELEERIAENVVKSLEGE